MNHRHLVAHQLQHLFGQQAPVNHQFNEWTPAAKHLFMQTCRYYPRLENIALQMLSKKPKDKLVWAALICGLCELCIDEKPSHAVIFEWVQFIKKSPYQSASGLVNAILRRVSREQHQLKTSDLTYEWSHPLWMIQRFARDWPEHWQDICNYNNQHPPMTLRVNLSKISREDYLKQIGPEHAQITEHSAAGIQMKQAVSIQELPGFYEGLVSIQDEAAQLAAQILAPQAGQRVLDACAAPGGKTCHLLESQTGLKLTAIEPQNERFTKLQQTLHRLQLNAHCIQADASQTSTWWDGTPFDRILIDAPCSGMGVIRRHPDIKLRRSETQLLNNIDIQRQLLDALWPLLQQNGLMLYATCSILPEENDHQIRQFLTRHQDARIMPLPIHAGKPTEFGQQIFPGMSNMDGFSYCLITKY
jgi:16S rRNA (cytosine967-C5)-methyltransferase